MPVVQLEDFENEFFEMCSPESDDNILHLKDYSNIAAEKLSLLLIFLKDEIEEINLTEGVRYLAGYVAFRLKKTSHEPRQTYGSYLYKEINGIKIF